MFSRIALVLRAERGGEVGARQLPFRGRQAHQLRDRAEQADDRQVGVIERLEQDDFVARVQDGHQAGGDRLGGAGGDDDLGRRVDLKSVETGIGGRDRLSQFRHAGHGRILIAPIEQRIRGGAQDVVGPVRVREALPEVDRLPCSVASADMTVKTVVPRPDSRSFVGFTAQNSSMGPEGVLCPARFRTGNCSQYGTQVCLPDR